MAAPRPFRFGAAAHRTETATAFAEYARRVEALGYATLLVADHFTPSWFAPGPALVAAACATTTLRVGCTVYAADFRHPPDASGWTPRPPQSRRRWIPDVLETLGPGLNTALRQQTTASDG